MDTSGIKQDSFQCNCSDIQGAAIFQRLSLSTDSPSRYHLNLENSLAELHQIDSLIFQVVGVKLNVICLKSHRKVLIKQIKVFHSLVHKITSGRFMELTEELSFDSKTF